MTTARIALAFLSLLFANSASAAREQHLCKEPAPVNALLASFGMNTHMQQGWQYEDAARTVSTLKELGITQVREAFTGLGHPGLRGSLSDLTKGRLATYVWSAVDAGADAIVVTCSTLGPAVDAIAPLCPVPLSVSMKAWPKPLSSMETA
ncbi:aspartate/glutamate racemase family protein [Mesorhizobium ventifaucium]|uniref:Uncharacterized protein n=1 Tax=Mesorhizobium ventifaucium TaxID=666020 RepID=A0ABM9DYN6_9HYPH|nr:aspartate/glutamate racemase family protein [Mesorhizobium ventifaucium]CAH2401908.1 exported hypothetical protein [Mesorhizobium ventifaucium]